MELATLEETPASTLAKSFTAALGAADRPPYVGRYEQKDSLAGAPVRGIRFADGRLAVPCTGRRVAALGGAHSTHRHFSIRRNRSKLMWLYSLAQWHPVQISHERVSTRPELEVGRSLLVAHRTL